jgi:hypothetical protein
VTDSGTDFPRECARGGQCRAANRWHRVCDTEGEMHRAAGWAEGYGSGFMAGYLAALTPDDRDRAGYAHARYEGRMAELEAVAAKHRSEPPPYWPDVMKGGWPAPPPVPDPDDVWPERDGWPTPPPDLR